MWLLDHNLPHQLAPILQSLGVPADTTAQRGWQRLSNGELVKTAAAADVTCILTKDLDFGHSAEKSLKKFPSICVILITLPQQRGPAYARAFQEAWSRKPIHPIAGKLIRWPS
jgi:predicted nuclease of predicted toxin-antitoxin system